MYSEGQKRMKIWLIGGQHQQNAYIGLTNDKVAEAVKTFKCIL